MQSRKIEQPLPERLLSGVDGVSGGKDHQCVHLDQSAKVGDPGRQSHVGRKPGRPQRSDGFRVGPGLLQVVHLAGFFVAQEQGDGRVDAARGCLFQAGGIGFRGGCGQGALDPVVDRQYRRDHDHHHSHGCDRRENRPAPEGPRA